MLKTTFFAELEKLGWDIDFSFLLFLEMMPLQYE